MEVDYSTFDSFVNSTNGQSIGTGECWDYINLIWSHLGSRFYTYDPANPSGTNHGVKWGWQNQAARQANTIEGIIQVVPITQVKRGDIVITYGGTYGHAGFAAEDYNGLGRLQLYSQNFNYKRYVSLDNNDMLTYAGAFRYTAWTPRPPMNLRKSHFKWALYARKLRAD